MLAQSMKATIGKRIRSWLAHLAAGGLHADQSLLSRVVSSLMIGGWITGTSAM
jgi:hypothetical protein